jgi:CRP-like cAMP-binding protein
MVAFDSHDHVFGLLVEGRATLSVRDAAGREVRIVSLAAGDFYGEATIAAGGRSEFRVVAETDVTAVEFAATTMAAWLQRSSGLAAEIGAAIDARRRAARAVRHPAAVQHPPAAAAFPQGTGAGS